MSNFCEDDGTRFTLSPALRRALTAANAAHGASLEALQDAICEYVEDLRTQGVPTLEIAGALRHRLGDFHSSNGRATAGVEARRIVDDMVSFCLDGGQSEGS